MEIFTIGFTKKSAQTFFDKIFDNNIDILIDIRLNNVSQLAGFAKSKDLEYFLKKICKTSYVHDIHFAPTKDILDRYKSHRIDWNQYDREFKALMVERNIVNYFEKNYAQYSRVCLLCSEDSQNECHRGIVAQLLSDGLKNINISIIHI